LRQETGVSNECANNVGVDIARWSSILDVAFAIVVLDACRDAEGGCPIGHTVGEFLATRRLMNTSESLLIVVTVDTDVELVLLSEVLHHLFDVGHAFFTRAHSGRRVVGVTSRTIPVGEQLGGERDNNFVVLSDSLEQVARDPQVVTDGHSLAWANLVL